MIWIVEVGNKNSEADKIGRDNGQHTPLAVFPSVRPSTAHSQAMSSTSTSVVSATTTASAGSSSTSSGSNSASSTLSIPQTAAAGGVTLTQPPQLSTSFFKIASGQLVTFGWNFTSVLATPTSLTVSAVCENGNTYPVGPTDGIIPGTATTVVWDPYSYDQNNPSLPLVQASYTLHIWDDRGPNVGASPGYMSPNTALKFALYTPQAYTPISSGEHLLL